MTHEKELKRTANRYMWADRLTALIVVIVMGAIIMDLIWTLIFEVIL